MGSRGPAATTGTHEWHRGIIPGNTREEGAAAQGIWRPGPRVAVDEGTYAGATGRGTARSRAGHCHGYGHVRHESHGRTGVLGLVLGTAMGRGALRCLPEDARRGGLALDRGGRGRLAPVPGSWTVMLLAARHLLLLLLLVLRRGQELLWWPASAGLPSHSTLSSSCLWAAFTPTLLFFSRWGQSFRKRGLL